MKFVAYGECHWRSLKCTVTVTIYHRYITTISPVFFNSWQNIYKKAFFCMILKIQNKLLLHITIHNTSYKFVSYQVQLLYLWFCLLVCLTFLQSCITILQLWLPYLNLIFLYVLLLLKIHIRHCYNVFSYACLSTSAVHDFMQ